MDTSSSQSELWLQLYSPYACLLITCSVDTATWPVSSKWFEKQRGRAGPYSSARRPALTNKPPIAAWAPSTSLRKLESRHNNAPCVITDGPAEFNDVPLIRLSDYQRLQAECEEELFCVRQDRDTHFGELMRALEQVDAMQDENEELKRALSESQANDRQAMAYLSEVRAIVGGDDFPDMVERVGALQAENAQLRAAIRRLCNIYVIDDYYDGKLREECLEAAVNRAIDAATQVDNDGR